MYRASHMFCIDIFVRLRPSRYISISIYIYIVVFVVSTPCRLVSFFCQGGKLRVKPLVVMAD